MFTIGSKVKVTAVAPDAAQLFTDEANAARYLGRVGTVTDAGDEVYYVRLAPVTPKGRHVTRAFTPEELTAAEA